MAPVENIHQYSNIAPLAAFGGVTVVFTVSLYYVVQSLVRLQRALPVAKRTRNQDTTRRKDVMLFAALAVLSLSVHLYNLVEVLLDSYTTYIEANNVDPLIDVWSSPLWFPRDNHFAALQLGAWWNSDTVTKAVAATIASPRDYWWMQQQSVAALVWVMFLSVEGRRRNIPHIWAYLLVAVTSNLAPAINLFFIALLLSPVPYKRPAHASHSILERTLSRVGLTTPTSRHHTWTPNAAVYITPLTVGILAIASFPLYAPGPLPTWLAAIPTISVLALTCIDHSHLLPHSLGTTHRSIHASHASLAPVFRTAALLALALHALSSIRAIVDVSSAQPAHSRFRLFDTTAVPESFATRYRHSISNVLGALSDGPLATMFAWDVVLTGLSAIVWAGTRGLEPTAMLTAIGVPGMPAAAAVASTAKEVAGRTARNVVKETAAAAAHVTGVDADREDSPPVTRSKDAGLSPPSSPSSKKSTPASKAATKTKAQSRTGASTASSPSRAAGRQRRRGGEDEDGQDTTYRPSKATGALGAGEHAEEHEGEGSTGEELESAAVAWGILVLGGLGVGLCGVAGGEVL